MFSNINSFFRVNACMCACPSLDAQHYPSYDEGVVGICSPSPTCVHARYRFWITPKIGHAHTYLYARTCKKLEKIKIKIFFYQATR